LTGSDPLSGGLDLADDDAGRLIAALGGGVERNRVAPWVFSEPLAPSVASRRAGVPLHHDALLQGLSDALRWWSDRADVLIVEGVGGWLCPLAEGTTVADLAIALDFPVVVVARLGLGTLNHTLLTVEAIRIRGARLAGVVLNGAEPTSNPLAEATNPEELGRRLREVPLLAVLPHGVEVSERLDRLRGADWGGRALPPRGATWAPWVRS
jgi:dethiobiotin synthetase